MENKDSNVTVITPEGTQFSPNIKYITVCPKCDKQTSWEYKPNGSLWVCSHCLCVVPYTEPFWINDYLKPEGKLILNQTVIYLSGPMTGIPDFNAPAFAKYAEKYRELGFKVISPPELDHGDTSKPYDFYLRRDIQEILDQGVTRMYMLPGWHKSKGARLEKHLAEVLGIEIWNAETGEKYNESIAQEAQRLVFNDRGEVYSHPFDDFGRTAEMANGAFKHKLKEGFTQEDIAVFMMLVKISRLINSPDHRDSLVDIPGYGLCYQLVRERRKELGL